MVFNKSKLGSLNETFLVLLVKKELWETFQNKGERVELPCNNLNFGYFNS